MARHPTEDTEDFLSRWSRRKSGDPEAIRGGADTAEETPKAPPADSAAPDAESAESPAKTDADMPPLDSIDEGTDVSDFFSPGVSDGLRQAALRKLFRLPKFNITDGLDDYDEDFRTFAALGDMITADMRHRMEVEAERAQEKAREAAAARDDAADGHADAAAGPEDLQETAAASAPEDAAGAADGDRSKSNEAEDEDEGQIT